ncbi:hypothetical protein BRC68_14465 [Halobacteriales archaeon QH_6_64_20]|nr:MAG: hypothetical protein BRC68_14465 [Halobacteriales archaeon QH_6_64_20]
MTTDGRWAFSRGVVRNSWEVVEQSLYRVETSAFVRRAPAIGRVMGRPHKHCSNAFAKSPPRSVGTEGVRTATKVGSFASLPSLPA